ncbi:MAG: phospho-N-acetylmuramoyl-pentapeptide-transferase [Candidatus Wallbacteria bacterium]|nr:phospho-N-acetylmuramoyl-pentapeptide-transferase [Candidatus Wallbacteria bacterium]
MFYYLIKNYFGDTTFSFIIIRSVFALLTSFIITLVLTPALINKMKARQLSQPIRDDGPKSHLINKKGTPSMGGLGVNIAVILSSFFWANLNNITLSLFILYIPMALLGLVDDLEKYYKYSSKGITARAKFLCQIAISLLFVNYIIHCNLIKPTLYIPGFIHEIDLGWFYFVFVVIVITAASNAVNLTDGLDGLAMGCSGITVLSYGVLAYLSGNAIYSAYLKIPHILNAGELLVVAAAILGASLGFLWYNSYPAQIFMGDTGSLALGSIIGGLAVLVKGELLLIIIGGIFVIEALSVIIQVGSFKLRGKRVFKMAPLHHHFELLGWAEPKIVLRFWLVTFILILFGFSLIGLNILK